MVTISFYVLPIVTSVSLVLGSPCRRITLSSYVWSQSLGSGKGKGGVKGGNVDSGFPERFALSGFPEVLRSTLSRTCGLVVRGMGRVKGGGQKYRWYWDS